MDENYIGSKEEEMDAEAVIVDQEQPSCMQCEQNPRRNDSSLCQACWDTIPF